MNGGFYIWQRGNSFTYNMFGPDRWYITGAGTVTVARSVTNDSPNNNYSLVWTTSANSSYCNPRQAIESSTVLKLRGKVVTVSFYVKSTGVTSLGTIQP
jgi:hypothetical protein